MRVKMNCRTTRDIGAYIFWNAQVRISSVPVALLGSILAFDTRDITIIIGMCHFAKRSIVLTILLLVVCSNTMRTSALYNGFGADKTD